MAQKQQCFLKNNWNILTGREARKTVIGDMTIGGAMEAASGIKTSLESREKWINRHAWMESMGQKPWTWMPQP